MKILICDDNKKDIELLSDLLQAFFNNKNIDIEITNTKDKMYIYKHAYLYDLLFLDIELDAENGIDIGLYLREHNIDTRIIITSLYSKYLIDGYKIHAERYFIKPIREDIFMLEMENIMESYYERYAYIDDPKVCSKRIYIKDIVYIEYSNRKSYVHVKNKVYETSYPLHYWEDVMKQYDSFTKSHRSFLVNIMQVIEMSKRDIIMSNKDKVPISRNYKDIFERQYVERLHKVI